MEWIIPAFDFPTKAGTHLLTLEGGKAELAWVAGYILAYVSGNWTQTRSPIQVLTGPDIG